MTVVAIIQDAENGQDVKFFRSCDAYHYNISRRRQKPRTTQESGCQFQLPEPLPSEHSSRCNNGNCTWSQHPSDRCRPDWTHSHDRRQSTLSRWWFVSGCDRQRCRRWWLDGAGGLFLADIALSSQTDDFQQENDKKGRRRQQVFRGTGFNQLERRRATFVRLPEYHTGCDIL